TCTANDGNGNTASCTFTVTVNDTEAPTIACPANVVVNTDPGLCSAVASYTVSSADNCPGHVVTQTKGLPSGAAFPKGITTNCFTVTDTSGNTAKCSFTVTVNDNQPPSISCPANITQSTDSGQCSAVVNYTIPTPSDNCPGATASCSPASGSTFAKGTTTVTCTATDASGNTASCSFTVTVNDTQAPVAN